MKVGLAACSNGHSEQWASQVDELCQVLNDMNIETVKAEHIMCITDEFSGTDVERAQDLMQFYQDDTIQAIYDISGGDLANGVLKYLDFETIKNSDKTFWGYSDLTTVINAIYSQTGKESVLFQVKNMVYSAAELQQKRFADYIKGANNELFNIDYDFLQGQSMEGILVGGNIRCLLKLAGTKYFPDVTGKILMLEAYGGESGQIATLFAQLELMGVFEKVAGVMLGTFTGYERANLKMSVFDLLKMHIPEGLPVGKTHDVGHSHDAKAVVIGRYYRF
ncbi:LD-carboxypeptidase [Butyrivibrio fibrisolvens]|uniref:LD-carboxypeptidase n=1 Tax=Pseudobutyrivibrio ruminis TaxID=46206 RepID=UPI00040CB3D7|nr:LD-carboxypeptidase [Pseudobutyrivibrio ruminis]MDC7279026.1 LD-carboxypeptidase [Butyrivibrio fibrisolvens]